MVLQTFFPSTSCGMTAVMESFKESGKAVITDFKNKKCSSSEKVQKFVTGFLDVGAIAQCATSGIFLASSISCYFIYNSFPGFISFMFTPALFITSIASAIIGFEVHQTRAEIQNFQDWIQKEFPNNSDPFYINDKFCKQWEKFKEDLNGQTLIVGFICYNALEQSSKLFDKLSKDLSTFDTLAPVRWFRDPDSKWSDLLGGLNPWGN